MYTYLALGDSYTIGERVPMAENFPHQLAQRLRQEGLEVADPVIIAKTGWTTDELAMAIREHNLHEHFSLVTLLIGVNNQYRGRDIADYKQEFTALLDQAIVFANGHKHHVFVLSIPDWGVTPFGVAEGRDQAQVSAAIDAHNEACKTIATAAGCHFTDITDSTRANGSNALFLAEDGLHPSAKEYAVWTARLAPEMMKALGKGK